MVELESATPMPDVKAPALFPATAYDTVYPMPFEPLLRTLEEATFGLTLLIPVTPLVIAPPMLPYTD